MCPLTCLIYRHSMDHEGPLASYIKTHTIDCVHLHVGTFKVSKKARKSHQRAKKKVTTVIASRSEMSK